MSTLHGSGDPLLEASLTLWESDVRGRAAVVCNGLHVVPASSGEDHIIHGELPVGEVEGDLRHELHHFPHVAQIVRLERHDCLAFPLRGRTARFLGLLVGVVWDPEQTEGRGVGQAQGQDRSYQGQLHGWNRERVL